MSQSQNTQTKTDKPMYLMIVSGIGDVICEGYRYMNSEEPDLMLAHIAGLKSVTLLKALRIQSGMTKENKLGVSLSPVSLLAEGVDVQDKTKWTLDWTVAGASILSVVRLKDSVANQYKTTTIGIVLPNSLLTLVR